MLGLFTKPLRAGVDAFGISVGIELGSSPGFFWDLENPSLEWGYGWGWLREQPPGLAACEKLGLF